MVLAGCDLRGPYYAGTIVEPPTQGEGDPADDNWVMAVDLDDREVLGGSRVIVGFHGADLMCEEETDVSPDEVATGGSLGFLRVGDNADASSPPGYPGRGHPGWVSVTGG